MTDIAQMLFAQSEALNRVTVSAIQVGRAEGFALGLKAAADYLSSKTGSENIANWIDDIRRLKAPTS